MSRHEVSILDLPLYESGYTSTYTIPIIQSLCTLHINHWLSSFSICFLHNSSTLPSIVNVQQTGIFKSIVGYGLVNLTNMSPLRQFPVPKPVSFESTSIQYDASSTVSRKTKNAMCYLFYRFNHDHSFHILWSYLFHYIKRKLEH